MPTFKNHPCPSCGTVKYKKTSDSEYVCKYGHQMVGYREEAGDEEALIGIRSSSRKKVSTTDDVTKRLYGAELDDALKRLFQYALQIMSRSFVHDLGFPAEFEYVVRELWILYLNDSKMTLNNAHVINENGSGGNGGTNGTFMAMDEEPEDLLMEPSSDSDYDSHDNNTRPLNDLPPNNDDNTSTGSNSTTTPKKKKKKNTPTAGWPPLRFRHILVVCYLGCMYLGWPVTLGDIRRWCTTLRLPYLHILKDLPSDTLDLVDIRFMINILQLPPTHVMQRDTSLLTTLFTTRTTVILPKPNAPLLIYRYCTQLFLPVEMYFCARKIYEEHSFTLSTSRQEVHHNYHNYDVDVMVIVLILAKLCYGLDDVKDIDPVYDDDTLPPPLPKQVWLEHIRANADHWERIYQRKMTDSPDIDLDLIIGYLKNSLPEDKHMKHEKKSLVRRHIVKMQNSLDGNIARQSNWSHDLLVDTPKLASTINEKNGDGDDDGKQTETRIIGTRYLAQNQRGYLKGKMTYPEEYELVLLLASRILGCNAQAIQRRLMTFEKYLKNL